MDFTERRLSGETIFSGHVFSVELDRVTLPDGREAPREVVRHPGGVGVLAIDGDGIVILVRQYRYASGKTLLEIPAGKLEPGEDPQSAGLRELAEETGYRASRVSSLGKIIPTGAYNSELIYLYRAEGLTPGETNPDDGEFVEVVRMPLAEAVKMALSGEIEDAKTVVALLKVSAE